MYKYKNTNITNKSTNEVLNNVFCFPYLDILCACDNKQVYIRTISGLMLHIIVLVVCKWSKPK